MRLLPRSLLLPLLLAGWLGGAATASATVRDDGKFFKPETVATVNKEINEIRERYKKDLVIETYKSYKDIDGPEKSRESVNLQDREERNKAFSKWAVERAEKLKVNGIYILICREPSHFQIEVGNKTLSKEFTLADRHKLEQILQTNFKEKKFDEGLQEAVDFVHTAIRRNVANPEHESRQKAQPSHPAGGGGGGGFNVMHWLLIGGAVLLGIWLISGLIRAFSGAGRGYGGGPGYAGGGYGGGYGGGGGGFMSSLMGGLFGAAAGNWIYDSFFRGSGSGSSWGSGPASSPSPTSSGPSGPDTDYSGEGGDFGDAGGDAGGGGDFDGGDFDGGGDFGGGGDAGGGGDFGGGGGDFGGGGGDF
jgi:uncharacterized protein